jgi:hypothetical protein
MKTDPFSSRIDFRVSYKLFIINGLEEKQENEAKLCQNISVID